ncbi:MAG: CAP domain-containing protein [Cyanobacteria bacterium J06636_16]
MGSRRRLGPQSETDRFDQEVLKLVNQERTQRDLKPLTLNAKLDRAADKHSKDMAEKDYFSHTGKNGSSIGDRASAAGYQWSRLGENIAAGQRTPESVVQGWMNSSGHRANILNPNYTHMGLGYKSLSPDTGNVNYGRYWTQMFGASRGSSNLTADALISSNDNIVSPDDSALISEQEQSGYFSQDRIGGVELNEGSQLLSDLMNDYQLGASFNQTDAFNSLKTYNQATLSDGAKAQNLVGIYDQTAQLEING